MTRSTGEPRVLVCAGQGRTTGDGFRKKGLTTTPGHASGVATAGPAECAKPGAVDMTHLGLTSHTRRRRDLASAPKGWAGRLPSVKRLHSAPGVFAAVLAALAISACSTMSPIQTTVSYEPGDGVSTSLGDVSARALLIVSDKKGGPGALSGSLLNSSDSPIDVRFQTRQESEAGGPLSAPIPLAPREQRQITEITFSSVDAAPGELTGVYMSTSAGKVLVTVPVMAPDGFYEELQPAESTPAPTTEPGAAATEPESGVTPTEPESTPAPS